MKTNSPPANAQNANQSLPRLKSEQTWLAAAIGAAVGSGGGWAYLLSGGSYLNVPQWASIVFYPGFVAGNWAYAHWDVGVNTAINIGVVTVGLAYALIAMLANLAWQAVIWLGRPSNEESEP